MKLFANVVVLSFFLVCTQAFANPATADLKTLIVAGGCFWCVESDFEKHKGVVKAVSGYTGGVTENPSYKEVTYSDTGHFEAVEITYDPSQVSLETLVDYFWRTIDPTDATGQFCDKGDSYKSALFFQNPEQEAVFKQSLAQLRKSKPFAGDIVTEILPAKTFYLAETYHQDYYKNSAIRYYLYRNGCGRDQRIEQLWGEVVSQQH